MVLPHGSCTGGAEAPRQRRAQGAEGKRLRGVAPVVASTAGSAGATGRDFDLRPTVSAHSFLECICPHLLPHANGERAPSLMHGTVCHEFELVNEATHGR
jgi:hypothetical protein